MDILPLRPRHPRSSKARLGRVALSLAVLGFPAVQAGAAPTAPTVWISPPASHDGLAFRELFTQPNQWKETRPQVDVLFYTDLNLNKQFSDNELRAWLPTLTRWHIRLALEVGAVKEWGTTGAKTFAAERPLWDRIRRLGGDISAIALDEPLTCVRQSLKKPDDYAVQETADYISLVRRYDPRIQIGDIEPYPSIPLADHLWWIGALQKRLAEKGVRGLNFYRLDVDWVNFVAGSRGSWPEVKVLEQHCRQDRLPFSLIYWAADYPEIKNRGMADDSTWYVGVMQEGYDYALVGGAPDQYVIESWVGAPAHSVPETGDWTFIRTVRDFAARFIKRGR